jgi:putative transposase
MYKKREFTEGAFYHVTSRTNDKIRVFENNLGRKIMLITLQDAKEKFHFILTNFCVMPTHIHLLIKPTGDTTLSKIMHWIKNISAKRWNFIHGSTDHLWGDRYFARAVRSEQEYEFVMNYIDQNPVKAGLTAIPEEWKASAAFYKSHDVYDLVDFTPNDSRKDKKLLPSIPFIVSRIIPPVQLEHIMHYKGVYAIAMDRLFELLRKIPKIGEGSKETPAYLHYYTDTHEYFICEYDGEDTMYGKIHSNVYPFVTHWQKFNLGELMKNQFLKLEVAATAFS